MIAILLPLAALAFVLSLPRRHEHVTPRPALPPAIPPHVAVGFAPAWHPAQHSAIARAPMADLHACLARGQQPPPQLAQWACAEAEALGRYDVAAALHQRFVAPFMFPPPVPATPENPAGGSSPSSSPASVSPAPVATSPIKGLEDSAWQALTAKLSRGETTFASQKRVGRYHQSRTRLRDLGLDPDALVGNPAAQDSALAADLVDGFQRARGKGLLAAIGQPIDVPGGDPAAPSAVSLSGLLGVLSVAGVDGLAGWLSSPEDRQRFPYTTNLFLQTNGMF